MATHKNQTHANRPSTTVKSGGSTEKGEIGPGVEKGAGGEMPFKPDELLQQRTPEQKGEGEGDPLDGT